MGVKSLTYEQFICDRCDKTEDIPSGTGLDQRSKWGTAHAQRMQGMTIFTFCRYEMTLCPDCVKSLEVWSSEFVRQE